MLEHIGMLLTSWAIVADVWYLPPVTQQEGESSIAYANRVKSEIARQGGLVDLEWYVFSITFSLLVLIQKFSIIGHYIINVQYSRLVARSVSAQTLLRPCEHGK